MAFCEHCEGQRFDRAQVLRLLRATRKSFRKNSRGDAALRATAKILAAQHPGLPVLYMSGYTDTTVVRGGRLDPGATFLPKPFGPEALLRKVREVLDAAAASRAADPPPLGRAEVV